MKETRDVKVLFISSWYPNRYEPHNGNFVERHAQAASLYADVVAWHVFAADDISTTEIKTEDRAGVPTVYVYYPKPKRIFFRCTGLIERKK